MKFENDEIHIEILGLIELHFRRCLFSQLSLETKAPAILFCTLTIFTLKPLTKAATAEIDILMDGYATLDILPFLEVVH